MWYEYQVRDAGFPYPGGWTAQPLDMLIQFQAMSLMYNYKMTMNQKKPDMTKLTTLQHKLAEWAESED
jgi:hypothetical protein